MIELYLCKTDERKKILDWLLKDFGTILRTPDGKPYIAGNPVYFSVSHSGDLCVITLSRYAIGVDCELERGKTRERIIKSFSEEEQAEIKNERSFLEHWTVREAYTKLSGGQIVKMLKKLKFVGGKLYADGEAVEYSISFLNTEGAVICVCSEEHDISVKDMR